MKHVINTSDEILTVDCKDIMLREYMAEDLDALHDLTWQPHFHEFLVDWNVSKEQREEWFHNYEIPENKQFLQAVSTDGDIGEIRLRLGIISKGTGKFIGVCGTGVLDKITPPKREIYYGIASEYRNNGYTTQAVKGLIHYLFCNTNTEQLVAIAQICNFSSNRVINKSGFVFERDIEIEEKKYHYYTTKKE
ncbi:GNAT family N-acetyltransferase [Paenibacillus sp. GYB006]|uniref:GNAT family N-acetyltransferase n=1 Tax=Paenibacillus sp. GYB006 TaxID=2994394 RepID=UPI002F963B90